MIIPKEVIDAPAMACPRCGVMAMGDDCPCCNGFMIRTTGRDFLFNNWGKETIMAEKPWVGHDCLSDPNCDVEGRKKAGMTFGEAVERLKTGLLVRRKGWDIVLGIVHEEGAPPRIQATVIRAHEDQRPYRLTWYPKQEDMLSDDWEVAG